MATVSLLTHTDRPETIVAAAAKLCYSPSTVEALLKDLTPAKSARFVDMLADMGHESPIEHCTFTFAVEGVSRALLAQLTRHRIASYSVQSQRYVSEGSFEYVVPPAIAENADANAEFFRAMEDAQAHYTRLVELLAEQQEKSIVARGVELREARRQAQKQAMEDARFVLPNACDTKLIVTMNARSLLNFFRHRCCNRAQWEIRALAYDMLRLVHGVAPSLFRGAGAPCVAGECPEGKMSCGRQAEVRSRTAKLKEAQT